MKKMLTVAFAALILAGTASFAQVKGDMYAGAYLGFNTKTYGETSQTGFGITAEYGYFFLDNCRVNLGLGYEYNGSGTSVGKTKSNFFVVEPAVAYYIKLTDKFFYTPEIGVDLYFGSQKSSDYDTPTVYYKLPEFCWELYLDFASFEYKFADNFSLAFNIGSLYFGNDRITYTNGTTFKNGEFGLSLLTSSSVGAKFYF